MNDKFPKVIIQNRSNGNHIYVDFYVAASRQNSYFEAWDVGDTILEYDGSVRKITEEEVKEINFLSDEMDASK